MTEGPFGLPRPFAESKPVLKVVMEEEEVEERVEALGESTDKSHATPSDTLYSEVLFNVRRQMDGETADSLSIGTRKRQGYVKERGLIHFGFDLSEVHLDDVAELRGVIKETMGDFVGTSFEVR